jgi:ABC-type transport system substrate-binding protein
VSRELDLGKRQSLYADFLKLAADEVLFLPIFYSSGNLTTTFRRGVRGPGPAPIKRVTTWNIHEWDVD